MYLCKMNDIKNENSKARDLKLTLQTIDVCCKYVYNL